MEKKWMFIPNSIIKLVVDTKKRVAIKRVLGGDDEVVDLQFPVEKPVARLLGNWIVECKEYTILLRANISDGSKGELEFYFEEKDAKIQATMVTDAGERAEVINTSEKICISPDNIKVTDGKPVEDKVIDKDKGEKGTTAEEKDVKPEEKTIPTKPQDSSVDKASAEKILELQQKLEAERAKNRQLQHVLEARLDEFIKLAASERDILDASAQEKLTECEDAIAEKTRKKAELEIQEGRKKEIEKTVQDAEAELLRVRNDISSKEEDHKRILIEMEKLKAQSEITELDCEKASAELDELKARVNIDQETLELLESSNYRLKKGTVSKTMVEIEKEIEKVEKKIGFFIKIRSKFNQAVETAIFEGDGTIPSIVEAGGENDGNGSTAPSED